MRTLAINEKSTETPEALHSTLSAGLAFPNYYGENLSALNDCLGDVDAPVRIVLTRAPEALRKEWMDGFIRVLSRTSAENPNLDFVLEGPEAPQTGEDVAERLARIEELLASQPTLESEALQAAPERVQTEGAVCRNTATGSEGDRFACSLCGCRVGDWLEETRMLFDGLLYCPNCGSKVANPGGSDSAKWFSELV